MTELGGLGIKVEIVSAEPLQDSSGSYVTFKIQTTATEDNQGGFPPGVSEASHRYSDFDTLHQFLKCVFPNVVVPPMPEKKINFKLTKMQVDKFDPAFIDRRRAALQQFLARVTAHPSLVTHSVVRHFLAGTNWKDHLVIETDGNKLFWNPSHFEERVKSLNISLRLKKPEKEFSDVKAYAVALQDHLSSIMTTHARLAGKTQQLFAQYDEYGLLMSEWSNIENKMHETLANVGIAIDKLNSQAEKKLKFEDEKIGEPLKEYVLFCDSLRDVALKQEHLQFDVEKAHSAVASKETSLAAVRDPSQEKGISGLFSRFKTTTEDEKRAKEAKLSDELQQLKEDRDKADRENEEFKRSAREEMRRFHHQRRIDLTRILIKYARLQEDFCEKNYKIWSAIKDLCK